MELLHRKTLKYASDKALLSLHRQLCALRGNGWFRTTKEFYILGLTPLATYHSFIVLELYRRNKFHRLDMRWLDPKYRGKNTPPLPYASVYIAKKTQKHRYQNELSRVRSIYILIKRGEFKLEQKG